MDLRKPPSARSCRSTGRTCRAEWMTTLRSVPTAKDSNTSNSARAGCRDATEVDIAIGPVRHRVQQPLSLPRIGQRAPNRVEKCLDLDGESAVALATKASERRARQAVWFQLYAPTVWEACEKLLCGGSKRQGVRSSPSPSTARSLSWERQ